MAAPKTTTWPLDDHTRAKHAILKRYLDAWIPILSFGGFPRIVFIDGYAGPGVYDDGSDGSPVIALKAYLDQAASITAEVVFHFVETDEKRAAKLREVVADLLAVNALAQRLSVRIHSGRGFEDVYNETIHPTLNSNVPVFAFIDPFGWKISMATIGRIMSLGRSEVFVNFMFEEVNRFLAHPDQIDNFDSLFGGGAWRRITELAGSVRREAIRDTFRDGLRTIGKAQYVRHFEMRNRRSQTDYYLFFATRSLKGLKKMKESMWKADPGGAFVFSDATSRNQMVLFDHAVDHGRLRKEIAERFGGAIYSVGEVEAFVVEETAFRESHYKPVLKTMEKDGALSVSNAKPTRRSGTFPDGTLIEFAKSSVPAPNVDLLT